MEYRIRICKICKGKVSFEDCIEGNTYWYCIKCDDIKAEGLTKVITVTPYIKKGDLNGI